MTEPIKSALTAEEWSAGAVEMPEGLSLVWSDFGVNIKARHADGAYLAHDSAITTVMAVLNSMLPSGFTREHVRTLRVLADLNLATQNQIAITAQLLGTEPPVSMSHIREWILNLADRIETLLPPEKA